MNQAQLEANILARGKEFFKTIGSENPSIFNKNWWTGKVMDWSMKHDDFKIQLFRFIDVLPYLTTEEMLAHHIQEYFSKDEAVPAVLRLGAKTTGLAGKLGTKVLGKTIRKNLEMMALQFIIGGTVEETVKNLNKLREKNGFAFTLDILGEATVSETEATAYVDGYMKLLTGVGEAQKYWKPLGKGQTNDMDWSVAPKINVSIKPSALYSHSDPADFEGTVTQMLERIKPVYRKVKEIGGFLCIDTEMRKLRHVIIELYKRLRSDAEFREYPHLGLAMQCYLNDSDVDLDNLLSWSRENSLPISIRLVKGAYWDYEVVNARQSGWDVPVYTKKAESDVAFERFSEKILRNHEFCHFAVASHNVRSVCTVIELAKMLGVPQDRIEFQALYGMAEPFRNALLKMTGQVRLYCPQGQLLPGMAYLIRRLLENTANESFLRQTFVEGAEMEKLLENPQTTVKRLEAEAAQARPEKSPAPGELASFRNDAFADCSETFVRKGFVLALSEVKKQLGKTYTLFIGGREVTTDDIIDSVNPAKPSQVVGKVCQAGVKEVGDAVDAAQTAFQTWRDVPARDRANYLIRAADVLRRRLYEISAWQILEEGKQWRQAYNDVTEAIDFLEYYARQMISLSEPQYLGHAPGEVNEYFYQPKGVAAVISPWNFPLAIACGMCSAALVTGNCVVFKPSNLAPVMGHILLEAFREVGLPEGVFNFTPGRGSVMGDFLVDHPATSLIAFTGSMEIGLRIIERAGKTGPDQINVKKIICEMGGKNAIIIDDDADLDEAVPSVLDSAFTFQGQKCSACSRVIVMDTVYDRFVERLVDAACSWKVGPSEDPAYQMGAVIDSSAQKTILEYVKLAKEEGKSLYSSDVPDEGYYVPMTIVEGITPEHRLAQEEVFGPVLAVMKVSSFDQALDWANATRFALTGALYSRSPEHLNRARKAFRVGNLYLNRGSTGALVERQPFGGFNMSGVGTKAGGPDYLLHFMDPRAVTENTLRRGFAPVRNDDEWV